MLRLSLPMLLLAGAAPAAQAQTMPALPADQARTEVLYRLTYRPDSTDPTPRTDQMRLQIGSKLSRFESRYAAYRDSVMHAEFEQAMKANVGGETPTINLSGRGFETQRPSTSAIIYKVPGARQVAVYDRVGSTHYTYQEPAELLTWTITPATATIAGYACQQATTTLGGRTWEAWFTRAVPVAEGPYKFYGLPGLIVKVGDTRNAYTFELIRFRQLASPVAIGLPEPAKSTTRQAFRQAKANYDLNGLAMMLASGNVHLSSPEEEANVQRKAQENAKKRNNPLELR